MALFYTDYENQDDSHRWQYFIIKRCFNKALFADNTQLEKPKIVHRESLKQIQKGGN
jgi:hypothetical protein